MQLPPKTAVLCEIT